MRGQSFLPSVADVDLVGSLTEGLLLRFARMSILTVGNFRIFLEPTTWSQSVSVKELKSLSGLERSSEKR
jgi:hypothetical protein